MEDGPVAEEINIAIVGGGICGLATALALFRKGIKSVVLEKSESLRVTGGAIGVLTNGWRALDQLGVGDKLRQTALPMHRVMDVSLGSTKQKESQLSHGEARALIRSELIKTLIEGLPPGTVRFGCPILSVKLDSASCFPIIQLHDGAIIKAKVLIGCDGASSVVAEFLHLKEKKVFNSCAVRGFTNYPNSHGFPQKFLRVRRDQTLSGRGPIDDSTVFWFLVHQWSPEDMKGSKDPEHIREMTLDATKEFPAEMIEMYKNCDLNSLSVTHLRYRTPMEVYFEKFRNGTVTVAGDAMHIMGPFLGQGGSAALEDAVVLARCLSKKLRDFDWDRSESNIVVQKVGDALDQYIKERRMRVVWLSLQTYLTGSLLEAKSVLAKLMFIALFVALFRDPIGHTLYDCGPL